MKALRSFAVLAALCSVAAPGSPALADYAGSITREDVKDAVRYGVKMSDEVPMTTQERAYTSPIWYTP